MADILKGQTFTPTDTVTYAKLHALVDSATLQTGCIMDRAVASAASTLDYILIYNDSAAALRRINSVNLLSGATAVGGVLQTITAETATQSNVTSIIPSDSTIPQSTEGTQILSASITPTSTSNKILVTVSGNFANAGSGYNAVLAIFRDSGANAIYATAGVSSAINTSMSFHFLDTPSSLAALTYALRVGPGSAGTIRINIDAVSNTYGGVMKTTITLKEIKG